MRSCRRCSLRTVLAIAIGSVSAALAGCLGGTATLTGGSSATNAPAFFPLTASPTIMSVPASTTVHVGEAFSFRPSATDADGDSLTYSISNRPRWLQFDPATGALSGAATAADVGSYANITISVSDGSATVQGTAFSLTVEPLAGSPPAHSGGPPSIRGTPATTAHAGQAYGFKPLASDPGGLPLTFSISNMPAWATFDPATGALAGTPAATDVGTFANVSISASDGRLSASLPTFTITVQPPATGSVTLAWQEAMLRTDGTPLTNLAGYRIYFGTASGAYANRITIANPGLSTYVVDNLPSGTYYFVMTEYDAAGNESAYSAQVSRTII